MNQTRPIQVTNYKNENNLHKQTVWHVQIMSVMIMKNLEGKIRIKGNILDSTNPLNMIFSLTLQKLEDLIKYVQNNYPPPPAMDNIARNKKFIHGQFCPTCLALTKFSDLLLSVNVISENIHITPHQMLYSHENNHAAEISSLYGREANSA